LKVKNKKYTNLLYDTGGVDSPGVADRPAGGLAGGVGKHNLEI